MNLEQIRRGKEEGEASSCLEKAVRDAVREEDPILVLPDGSELPSGVVLGSRESRKKYLLKWAGSGRVYCTCTGCRIEMRIGLRRAPHNTPFVYHPHRGDEERHAPWCPFREVRESSGSRGRGTSVPLVQRVGDTIVVSQKSGCYVIVSRDDRADPEELIDPRRGGNSRRPRFGGEERSLLEASWDHSGLTRFDARDPSSLQTWDSIAVRLNDAAKTLYVNWKQQLSEFLLVAGVSSNHSGGIAVANIARFRDALRPRGTRKYFGYVVGLFEAAEPCEVTGTVSVRLRDSDLELRVSSDHWQKRVKGLPKGNVVMIARVLLNEDGDNLDVDGFAFMGIASVTTPVPVDSLYEVRVVEKLVRERRYFAKPVAAMNVGCRYPDFILLDCRAKTYVEIFGFLSNPKYKAKADEKISDYSEAGIILWTWSPTSQADQMPPFPPAEIGGEAVIPRWIAGTVA
jgi:hypothetical protein